MTVDTPALAPRHYDVIHPPQQPAPERPRGGDRRLSRPTGAPRDDADAVTAPASSAATRASLMAARTRRHGSAEASLGFSAEPSAEMGMLRSRAVIDSAKEPPTDLEDLTRGVGPVPVGPQCREPVVEMQADRSIGRVFRPTACCTTEAHRTARRQASMTLCRPPEGSAITS